MAQVTSAALNKTEDLTNKFKSGVKSVEGNLEKMSHDAGIKMGEVASDVVDSAAVFVKTGQEYVKKNPARGIAFAAMAGAIIGGLATLSLRRRK